MKRRIISILLALLLVMGVCPTSVFAVNEDFVIENGVLTKYNGPGGEVVIPNGVTSIGMLAFKYCTSLTSITIPDSVTSIGSSAFYGCTNLASVTIPNSVTAIEETAFTRCTSLTSVTIPDSVTVIGNFAFEGCTGLTNITIGNRVTTIGHSAFMRCTNLTSITIPNSVTRIDNSTFYECSSLTSINIPNSVTSIGSYAFHKCSGLTSINIPNSVVSIGYEAFYKCTGLTRITLPASVTSIGGSVFYRCTGLTIANISNSVTSIGDDAFYGCTNLTSIAIPDSVTSIGPFAFYDCTDLRDVYYSGTEAYWEGITIGRGNYLLTSATIHYNSSGPCIPTPTPPDTEKIALRTDKDTLTVGEELPIVATIHTPNGFSESDITWTSSNESIATVTPSGALIANYSSATALVKGVAPGEVTITVTLADGRRAQYTLTITNSTKSKNYIIERVKSYTSDEIHDQWTNIMESNDSDEIKAERLVELFLHNGFTDPREGVAYLSQVSADRLDYIMLTSNECYSAYQYYNWLYNTASGKAALALLWADGLIFNNELSTWTNPLTYAGEKDLPGVAKYKDMLYNFMNATSFDIELMQHISDVKNLAKNTTSGGDMYAQKLIAELNECKNTDEILECLQETNPSAKGLYLNIKESSENDSGLSFKLDETSGFGKFSKAMGYSGKILSVADVSISFAVDLLTLDSKLAVYEQYRDFLQEVMTSSDLPWELSLAAYSVLQEMEDGAYGEIKDFAITLIEQTGVTQIITNSVWTKLLGEVGASTFTGYLSLIEIESWCINKIVDVGAMVKEVGCIVGYAKLQLHFVRKLEESKSTFLKNQTEETAWDFFENYNLLYQLRSEGEKAVQELYKIDGFASYFTDFGHSETIEKINLILQKLENCRFTVDENIEIPKSVKYVSKAVIRCPVNVEIFAPNGDYITTLVDGVESDVTNEYGRFAVVYQVCSNDYAKVICFSNEGDYTIKLVGVDDGSVDFDFARSVGNNSELYGFSKVGVSQDTVIQTSTNQIVYSHDYDIDFDGDGVFENNGTFQKIESIATPSFTDIKSTAYYYDAVIWAVRNGITSGTSATSFSPDASCTRGQIVTFLWRNAGRPDPKTSSNPFADVKSTDYYYKAVLWAVENNITSGVGKGKFAPSQPCTRGQAVTFLWRAAGRPGVTNTDNSFTDVKPGSYYGSAVNWAVVSKITSGTSVTTFGPEQPCTRGQIVTFLYRAKG